MHTSHDFVRRVRSRRATDPRLYFSGLAATGCADSLSQTDVGCHWRASRTIHRQDSGDICLSFLPDRLEAYPTGRSVPGSRAHGH